MLRLTILSLLIPLLFFNCSKESEEDSPSYHITKLQKAAALAKEDSVLIYLQTARSIISNSELPILDSLKVENNYLIGLHYRTQGKLDSAETYFRHATTLTPDSISNWREVQYYYELYDIYLAKQKYGDILALSNGMLEKLSKNDHQKLAYKYYFDTNAYQEIPDYQKAIVSNKKRIFNLLIAGDTVRAYPALITEAKLSYKLFGNTNRTFKILDSLEANSINILPDFKRQLYGTYGVYKFYDGDFLAARNYYKEAIKFVDKGNNNSDEIDLRANIYNNLMEVNIELNDFLEAKKYEDSILSLGIHKIARRYRRSFLKYQYRLASKTNQNESIILNTLDTLSKYQDLVYEEKIGNELDELKRKNAEQRILMAEKQAAEIASINLKNQSIVLGISLVLLTLTTIFFFRQRKLRFEKQEMQMQQRLLRSQMNPHFTFNTLYAIQNKIKEDAKGATHYLLKFSRLLRLILENSTQNYISLEKELESLKEYMELQLLRFPNRFNYTFEIDKLEDLDLLFIPPMLLQPMVENSIEHGFANIDYEGSIRILLELEGPYIRCHIEDNGQGIRENDPTKKRSLSTQLISEYLYKSTKSKLEIIDKKVLNEGDHGVLVRFLIPYKNTENG